VVRRIAQQSAHCHRQRAWIGTVDGEREVGVYKWGWGNAPRTVLVIEQPFIHQSLPGSDRSAPHSFSHSYINPYRGQIALPLTASLIKNINPYRGQIALPLTASLIHTSIPTGVRSLCPSQLLSFIHGTRCTAQPTWTARLIPRAKACRQLPTQREDGRTPPPSPPSTDSSLDSWRWRGEVPGAALPRAQCWREGGVVPEVGEGAGEKPN
jgi:hypothetical protein